MYIITAASDNNKVVAITDLYGRTCKTVLKFMNIEEGVKVERDKKPIDYDDRSVCVSCWALKI